MPLYQISPMSSSTFAVAQIWNASDICCYPFEVEKNWSLFLSPVLKFSLEPGKSTLMLNPEISGIEIVPEGAEPLSCQYLYINARFDEVDGPLKRDMFTMIKNFEGSEVLGFTPLMREKHESEESDYESDDENDFFEQFRENNKPPLFIGPDSATYYGNYGRLQESKTRDFGGRISYIKEVDTDKLYGIVIHGNGVASYDLYRLHSDEGYYDNRVYQGDDGQLAFFGEQNLQNYNLVE